MKRPAGASARAATGAAGAVLAGLFDDASLFPPASWGMAEALREHARQRRGPRGWALGRFAVPVSRLDELAIQLERLPPAGLPPEPWRLTAIAGPEPAADVRLVREFAARYPSVARIESFEAVLRADGQAESLRRALPGEVALGLELPREAWRGSLLESRLDAVEAARATAKLRAGGTRAADIPPAAEVLGFLEACARRRLAFKATAGLHHPVRGPAPLTYEPGSARATMHGYLNLLLAAAALWHGRPVGSARHLLESEDRRAFRFAAEAAHWRSLRFTAAELAEVRREFATAIGSCSFREPIAEFEALGFPLEETA